MTESPERSRAYCFIRPLVVFVLRLWRFHLDSTDQEPQESGAL